MSLTMVLSNALKQNDELLAELEYKDEVIKKLIISLLAEEEKNAILSNQLEQELQDLDACYKYNVQKLEERYKYKIDFLYSCTTFSLGTAILVLLFKLVE